MTDRRKDVLVEFPPVQGDRPRRQWAPTDAAGLHPAARVVAEQLPASVRVEPVAPVEVSPDAGEEPRRVALRGEHAGLHATVRVAVTRLPSPAVAAADTAEVTSSHLGLREADA